MPPGVCRSSNARESFPVTPAAVKTTMRTSVNAVRAASCHCGEWWRGQIAGQRAMPKAPPQHKRKPTGARHKPKAKPQRQEGSRHPFEGRKGNAARDRYAATLYVEQHGLCRMCSIPVSPTLRGRSGERDAVVDHIRPWRLRPDLAHDAANLALICRRCHARCDGIEKRHWPDAERIAAEKRGEGGLDADGRPVRTR